MPPFQRFRDRIREDTALVAALGNSTSAWIVVGDAARSLEVGKTSTGGTYALEVEWSRDAGGTVAATRTPTVPEGGYVRIDAEAGWVRVRVRNTHASAAFTAHRTTVDLFVRDRRPMRRRR